MPPATGEDHFHGRFDEVVESGRRPRVKASLWSKDLGVHILVKAHNQSFSLAKRRGT